VILRIFILILLVYTTENKLSVINFRTLTHTSAVRVNEALQFAHSEAFIKNAPQAQEYGSKSSIYRWETKADGAKLKFEVDLLLQEQRYNLFEMINIFSFSLHWDFGRCSERNFLIVIIDTTLKLDTGDTTLKSLLLPITSLIVTLFKIFLNNTGERCWFCK
jgi:hypothetical protein